MLTTPDVAPMIMQCSVMYAIAVVEIQLEVVSITTLLFFVMPLSLTLTTFLLWIMYGLQGKAYLPAP